MRAALWLWWAISAVSLAGGPSLAKAKVGEWVLYRMDGGPGRVSYLRLAVVAEERDRHGRDAVWIELEIDPHEAMAAPVGRIALLAARDGALGPSQISRVLVAAGAGPPVELSEQELPQLWPAWLAAPMARRLGGSGPDPRPGFQLRSDPAELVVGSEVVTVRCTAILSGASVVERFCVNEDLPILGLASAELPALGQSLRLRAFGTAATRRMLPSGPDRPTIAQER